MIGVELDGHGADHSLVARLQNAEVVSQLVYGLDGFAEILHGDLLCVAVGSHLPQQREAFVLFKESAILFAHRDANVHYLDLRQSRQASKSGQVAVKQVRQISV